MTNAMYYFGLNLSLGKKKAIKDIIKSIVKMDAHPQGPNRGLLALHQDPSQVW